jgi:sugar lactone lactonase YvrE
MRQPRFSRPRTRSRLPLLALVLAVPVVSPATGSQDPPPVPPSPNRCLPGTGSRAWCGDRHAATKARLAFPTDVAVTPDGGFVIADNSNNVIRRVSRRGIIRTIAGDGVDGDATPVQDAAHARFRGPHGVSVDTDGSILVADSANNAIRRIRGRVVTTVASPSGPIVMDLGEPEDVVATADGILVANTDRHVVQRIRANGSVETVAGNRHHGFSGDGGPATAAELAFPEAVAVAPDGAVIIFDGLNRSVRRVAPDGTITTVMDHVPRLRNGGVVTDRRGRVLVTDTAGILRLGKDGVIRRVAGTRRRGFNRDRGPANRTRMNCPRQLALDRKGRVLVADTCNDRIRRLSGRRLTTVAGSGKPSRNAFRATARGALAHCVGYNPQYHPFGFQPLAGGRLTSAPGKIRFTIATARVARVTVKVVRRSNGRVLRRRTKTFEAGSVRRLTLKRPVGRGKYRAVASGVAVHDPVATRCDKRKLRVKR